jgi:hypothetical protein
MRPTSTLIALIAVASAIVLGVLLGVRKIESGAVADERSTDVATTRAAEDSRSAVSIARDGAANDGAASTREPAVAQDQVESTEPNAISRGDRALTVRLFGIVRGMPRVSERVDGGLFAADLGSRIDKFGSQRGVGTSLSATEIRPTFVTLRDEDGAHERALVAADGSYALPALHPGAWELAVDVPERQLVRIDVELDANVRERRLDVELQPRKRLQVAITARAASHRRTASNGEPISSDAVLVTLVTTREQPAKVVGSAQLGMTPCVDVWLFVPGPSDADEAEPERAKTSADQTRTLQIADALPVYVSATLRGAVIDTQRVDENTDAIAFELEGDRVLECGGSIRLRVVDGDGGAPPSDCRVRIDPSANLGWRIAREAPSAIPDRHGEVTFSDLYAGPTTLTIRAEGYESIVRTVDVKPGGVTDLGTCVLDRWCTIRGRTLDAENQPVVVIVNAFPLDRFEETRAELSKRCYKSNEDGELTISTVGRGRYLLRVRDEQWGAAPVVVDTTSGSVHGISIVMKRKVDVALRFERALPADTLLRLVDDAGLPVLERERSSGAVQRIRAVPGLYSLRLTRRGEDILQSALFVGAEPSEVSMRSWK